MSISEFPRKLRRGGIFVPADGDKESLGTILLAHGFGLPPKSYSRLCARWASEGWNVFVPHLYSVFNRVGTEIEPLKEAIRLAQDRLPRPFVLAGHSRGGQAVLMLLLLLLKEAHESENIDLRKQLESYSPEGILPHGVRGLILLDPVEGRPKGFGSGLKHVLLDKTFGEWIWNYVPVLTVGGRVGTRGLMPAAPPGHNYLDINGALHNATPLNGKNKGNMYLCDLQGFGHLDYLNSRQFWKGLVPAFSKLFVPGTKGSRESLHEFCQKATTLIFSQQQQVNVRKELENMVDALNKSTAKKKTKVKEPEKDSQPQPAEGLTPAVA